MPSLYQLSDEIAAILSDCDENGELSTDAYQRLEAIDGTAKDWINWLCMSCKNEESAAAVDDAFADQLKAEIDRYRDRAKAKRKRSEKHKDYMKSWLEQSGQTKFSTERFTVAIQQNSVATVPDLPPGSTVPDGYQRIEITLDKDKVRNAAKAGVELPAGITCERSTHLRIR